MKIVRYKKVQRYLNFYCNNFGFRVPYQVLVDGTFCFAARKEQIDIKEQIPKYLVGEVKLLTTKCLLIEVETIAHKVKRAALTIIKQFALHECGHKEPISAADCIQSMVAETNPSHYIVATQDRELQDYLRTKVVGVPLLYLHLKAPVLEKPSEINFDVARNKQEQLLGVNNTQEETLTQLKKKYGIPIEEVVDKKKKKRKGGPNPLSCLKKKKKSQNVPQVQDSSRKIKKRRRVKLPAHVKEAMNAAKMKN